jgi:hypothetical protein
MKRIFCFVTVWFIAISLFAQQDTVVTKLASFVQNIDAFNRLYPQEKVYLHFDNTGYYLGETIWFKAYTVNASDHRSTTGSRVLYVELFNPRGILLETKKLKIVDGQCHACFFLSTSNYDYHGGFYEIRAYTKTMLNFGVETVFSRVFPVFNEPKKEGDYAGTDMKEGEDVSRMNFPSVRKKPKKAKKVNLDFYPEGGNLVTGLSSALAFKATDDEGRGIEITGEALSPKGETIAEFSSVYNGMGSFEYIPDGNKNKVKIRYDNRTYDFNLPASLPGGYSLKVNNLSKKSLVFQIEKSPDKPVISLGLSIFCRGKIVYFQTLKPESQALALRISKEELPAGVNQITLFDAKGEIHAERLVFISPTEEQEEYIIKTIPDKNEYKVQEKINIDFSTKAPETRFSVSVRDIANTITTADAGNILSNLLLSSDLKGYVENPSFYFTSDDALKIKALDLLMMVQGWKRYEWQTMSGIKPFSQDYDMEKGLKIKGKIVGESKEVKIELDLKDGNLMEGFAIPDSQGNFSTDIEDDLQGTYSLMMFAPGLKNANVNIRMDKWFSPPPKTYSFYETTAVYRPDEKISEPENEEDDELIQESQMKVDSLYKLYNIKEVEIGARRGKGKEVIYNVERDRDKAIDMGEPYPERVHDYLVQYGNGYYVLKSFNQGMDNVIGGGNFGWFWWGTSGFQARYMLNDRDWMLDTNQNSLYPLTFTRNLKEVQKIVIKEWEAFPNSAPIAKNLVLQPSRTVQPFYVYPYMENDYYNHRKSLYYRVTPFSGYSYIKDFYTGRPERENYVPDRSEHTRTLYWNPDIKTDSNGKARVSFYNNAFCRQIDISAEGLTEGGIPVTNKNRDENENNNN